MKDKLRPEDWYDFIACASENLRKGTMYKMRNPESLDAIVSILGVIVAHLACYVEMPQEFILDEEEVIEQCRLN